MEVTNSLDLSKTGHIPLKETGDNSPGVVVTKIIVGDTHTSL
jgi:hypothetical protein